MAQRYHGGWAMGERALGIGLNAIIYATIYLSGR